MKREYSETPNGALERWSAKDQRDRSLIFFHKNLRITLFICIFAAFCRIFKFIYPELA